jgi:hypothetical protein
VCIALTWCLNWKRFCERKPFVSLLSKQGQLGGQEAVNQRKIDANKMVGFNEFMEIGAVKRNVSEFEISFEGSSQNFCVIIVIPHIKVVDKIFWVQH